VMASIQPAAVKAVELTLVRQQLDDDDGAGKRQGNSHIDGLHRTFSRRQYHTEANHDGEGQLAQPRGQRGRPQSPPRCTRSERVGAAARIPHPPKRRSAEGAKAR
jgi:hypothetical protein